MIGSGHSPNPLVYPDTILITIIARGIFPASRSACQQKQPAIPESERIPCEFPLSAAVPAAPISLSV
jgi:hypothetical protein